MTNYRELRPSISTEEEYKVTAPPDAVEDALRVRPKGGFVTTDADQTEYHNGNGRKAPSNRTTILFCGFRLRLFVGRRRSGVVTMKCVHERCYG